MKLQDREFTDQWGSIFPWIFLNIMTDYERDADNLQRWQDGGIDLVAANDPRYPPSLMRIHEPPPLLFGKGNWACLRRPCLAVVGNREPSDLSLAWIEAELGKFLKENPCTLVSGGARGVDMAAHRIAIRKSAPTAVLFPSGLEQMYPATWSEANYGWSSAVLQSGGLLLSEYAPPVVMTKGHFIERNRLISGLASATLLIEARLRSGTLVTARAATDQGRPLFVLPSHPYDPNARGGLDLITEGAAIIRDAEDLSLFFRTESAAWDDLITTNWLPEKLAH